MSAAAPAPASGVIAVILGAAEFRSSKFPRNDAFARSAAAFEAYLLDPAGLGLEPTRILNLFGSTELPGQQLMALDRHLDAHRPTASDLIIYYVGHGGFLRNRDYFLALHATGDRDDYATALEVEKLGLAVGEHFRRRRIYVLLDCCFAGQAARVAFQSGELELAQKRARAAFPTAGTALLAAASKEDAATVEHGEAYSTFTKFLLRALREGVPQAPRRCSLYDIGDRIRELLDAEGIKASRPQVHAPEQHDGDVARFPLFPNPLGDTDVVAPVAARPRRWPVVVAIAAGVTVAAVAAAFAIDAAGRPSGRPVGDAGAQAAAVDAATIDAAPPVSELPDNPWRPIPGRPADLLTYEVSRADYVPWLRTIGGTRAPWRGGLVLADGEARLPATGVTWNDALAYCTWLGGRLPSVEEWKAAVAPVQQVKVPACTEPRAVGTAGEPVSSSGFHDLLSNVDEWVDQTDGFGKALRLGVDCYRPPTVVNDAIRRGEARWLPVKEGAEMTGFRCARDRVGDGP